MVQQHETLAQFFTSGALATIHFTDPGVADSTSAQYLLLDVNDAGVLVKTTGAEITEPVFFPWTRIKKVTKR